MYECNLLLQHMIIVAKKGLKWDQTSDSLPPGITVMLNKRENFFI